MSNLGKAISITANAFVDKTDKGGTPYIMHCLFVMNAVSHYNDEELMMAAVMHDLIEDTGYDAVDLIDHGFSYRVVELVSVLTHDPADSYDEYINKIKKNPDATKIKIADLRHNSDINRMKGLREKDFKRLEKYHRSYAYLTS